MKQTAMEDSAIRNQMSRYETSRDRAPRSPAADLLALFKQVATEVDKREFPHIAPEATIADLGIDSLAMMQIVSEMEQRLDVTVADEDLVELTTVADVVRLLERALGREH
jgi:acyl carrier protein